MSPADSRGNIAKYLSYRLAHDRMKAAVEQGFPLEAVAIVESIITDRLLSHVNRDSQVFQVDKATLGRVSQRAAKISKQQQDEEGVALAKEAQFWADQRNEVLHGIAKSSRGEGPKVTAEDFVNRAEKVAVDGIELVKRIKAWHGRLLRAARKSVPE